MTRCNTTMLWPKINTMPNRYNIKQFAAFLAICLMPSTLTIGAETTAIVTDDSIVAFETITTADTPTQCLSAEDRLWMISSRHITSEACQADLNSVSLRFSRLYCNGQTTSSSVDEYFSTLDSSRPVVVYVHGNRQDAQDAIERGLFVYRETVQYRCGVGPIDWVIWSWPSDKEGILVKDAREKAYRTDAQGLYLASILRRHAEQSLPTTLIGYSFGGRVITGALHAMAGGSIGRRTLPGAPVIGASYDVGLVAPAIENDWMDTCGYHSLATQNIDRIVLLYNQRDAVLKRYWLLDKMRSSVALGYSGPKTFADRFDGTRLPVRSRDCSPVVGLRHVEEDYYKQSCRAGREMASLIAGSLEATP